MKDYKMYAQREMALQAAYDSAETEEAQEQIRNEHHALMDEMRNSDEGFQKISKQWYEAQQRENDLIDINNCIWDKDVPPMIARFREYGIEQFTFSSGWSSSAETAWLFIQEGCKLEGMVLVNDTTKDFLSKEFKKIPAYLFSVK